MPDSAWAAWATPLNAFGLPASEEKAFGLPSSAAITCGWLARDWNPGLPASERRLGSFTIASKASVCISSGTAVSPSVTSPSLTWLETYRPAGVIVPGVGRSGGWTRPMEYAATATSATPATVTKYLLISDRVAMVHPLEGQAVDTAD